MQNNTKLQNLTYYTHCIDFETLLSIRLSILSVSSVLSFVGNLVVILIVYKTKELRTSTNYIIVNMSVSDILFTLFYLLHRLGHVLQFAGNFLCKLRPFVIYVSYGVSMLSLVVITVYRFSAVMFPMRARVQNKRKRILVLLLTWAIPIAVYSPEWVYGSFDEEYQYCYYTLTINQLRIWWTVQASLFFFLPLLIMLVLYPVILVKLRQHKVPGNANRPQDIIRRRKQNLRLTMMFIVISAAFVLTWGFTNVFFLMFYYFRSSFDKMYQQSCAFQYFDNIIFNSPVVFPAINPMIYFIFCSSYRTGLKQIFSCICRSARGHQAAAVNNNIELCNLPQVCRHS